MLKRYEIELDRNERDFATFLKSREVSLSKNDLRVLIASRALEDKVSLFDTDSKGQGQFKKIKKSGRVVETSNQTSNEKQNLLFRIDL